MFEEAISIKEGSSSSSTSTTSTSSTTSDDAEDAYRKLPSISKLLLPDMTLEIAKRRLTKMHATTPLIHQQPGEFCLAWLHPRGIKIRTIDLADDLDADHHNDSSADSEDDADADAALSYKIHLKQHASRLKARCMPRAHRLRVRAPSAASELQTVTDEWQGYQNAMDVLLPFGYSTVFVREVLQFAAEYEFDASMMVCNPPLLPPPAIADIHSASPTQVSRRTSFAVRGTTFARPHGYCLCWANDEMHMLDLQAEMHRLKMNNNSHRSQLYESKAMRRRDKRRRIRMTDSLPRTCLSTLAKNPDYQGQFGHLEGRRQRCIQFLNAEKKRAVYMRTHPFDCGPIQAPITMFLVAIATEDGCFVSGLKRRFELGHLYGNSNGTEDSVIDMSPICLATESSTVQSSGGSRHNSSQDQSSIANGGDDSDDSTIFDRNQIEEIGDMNCHCKIQCQTKYDGSDSDDDESFHAEVEENRIVRGALGPGRWHLYTAVFDGSNSVIRVDGEDEPTEPSSRVVSANKDDFPILDGLTIGSDHLFDMSLCFGEGSDGEGSGSISELAVFKGAMDLQDIKCFERHLMKRHGIINHGCKAVPKSSSPVQNEVIPKVGDQWEEDTWIRDVHALMVNSPPLTAPSGNSIPLRVAARHRSVAWERCCEVTGKPFRISRIGSKHGTGSSDW